MSTSPVRALSLGAVAVVAIARAGPLTAQGLNVSTHSACMLARAAAGVAGPCADGSAVFYSPALLADQPGAAAVGVTAIGTAAAFTFDGSGATFESTQPVAWVPHLWASVRPGPRLAVAVGAYAPYGLNTRWPLGFEGRYVGYDNTLRSIYIQPTVAYRLVPDRLSLGVGVALVRGAVEIGQRLDLAAAVVPGTDLTFAALGVLPGTDFADLRLEGDVWTATFHVAAALRASDRLRLGIRYLHRAGLDIEDGTAAFRRIETGLALPPDNPFGVPGGTPVDAVLAPLFTPGGGLADQRLRTELTLPGQLVAGARYRAGGRLDLLADYQWTGWDVFDVVRLDFERAPDEDRIFAWNDASTVRLGADYRAGEAWRVRAGVVYNTAAVSDRSVSPLLPEDDRITLTAGLGYRDGRGLRLDAGFEYILAMERRGRVRPRDSRLPGAGGPTVGEFESSAYAIAVTLVYQWGRRGGDGPRGVGDPGR